MQWETYVNASEDILSSQVAPSSLEIITLIKKVNPTRLSLSESDRERGYQLKSRLQSLLLEHYGETFDLVPHPASPNIILIKHRLLPSIDACHADLASLSNKAIEMVEASGSLPPEAKELKPRRQKARKHGDRKTGAAPSPKQALKKARALLEAYDYIAAEELLAGLYGSDDLRSVLAAASILLHEIGAYQRCIDTLLSVHKTLLRNRGLREMLAVAYHHNGSLPEARAILDELYPAEQGQDALLAYADIAYKDGNLSSSLELIKIARGKGGFFPGLDTIEKEIEAAMSAKAEPLVKQAQAALGSAAIGEAGKLAREALDLFPKCHQAREIISAIEARNDTEQLAELWARLENEKNGERRMALLVTLLKRDQDRRDTLKKLLAEEKKRQRRMHFDEQLESLRSLVHRESWPECYDLATLLMRQPEFIERAEDVLSLSPFFPVLQDYKRRHCTSDRGARDLWLRFVKVKSAFAAGNGVECFEEFEALKPWFHSCSEFQEDYLVLLRREQEQARAEVAAFFARSEASDCSFRELQRVQGSIRRRISVLPVEERRELLRSMEARLTRSIPEEDPAPSLDEYREALQIGNSERITYLRQEITDKAAREAVDAQFAELYHIDWEPLTLEVSDDLPVDLISPPPLLISYVVGNRMLLKDGCDTFVMIDFPSKTACRLTSPVFSNTKVVDYTKNDCFLFMEEEEGTDNLGDILWRAEISMERAGFSAKFDTLRWFNLEEGYCVANVNASSERDTEYFVLIKHVEGRYPAKILKKRIAPQATMQKMQIGSLNELKMFRWGSDPDNFIVGCEGGFRTVNRNLSLQALHRWTPDLFKIDKENGYVYGLEVGRLTQRNRKLELLKVYENVPMLAVYESQRVHGLSFQTDTALIVVAKSRQSFYNLRNNKMSSKIRVGRVIPSYHDGKWYCFDYSNKERKLWLREVNEYIQTELEWREIFLYKEKRDVWEPLMKWFNQPGNFLYRPEEWEADEATSADGED
uniref:Tetratricopeptide repeat protein n=1 Tax=Geobacter sp. (strain M21) TaxID=443144 RepID=C6E5Y6_GEOSM